MRNLKRALSLLLSSTMVLGMVVMGGSAAGYQDVDDTYHKEAIEVLQAAGIMTGVDSAGNFNPNGTVTRNEMAVIMANLMAYNVATYKDTSPFTDVPSWAEPYVAACWTNGITAGISATEYGGDQTVTTAQAALMIMKALGYFQYQSDFGSDWQLATVSQGNKIDLFEDVKSGVKESMTRNDVAQLVLNGLESGTVEAESNGSITVGDTTIISGVKYNYITSGQSYARAINSALDTNNDATTSSGSIVELGEKLYQGNLMKKSGQDDFGRPASIWSYNNKEVGTYADEADYTYTKAISQKDLYNELGATVVGYTWDVYRNGESLGSVKPDKAKTADYSKTATGTLTEVFVDNVNKNVTVTQIDTFLAEVVRVSDDKKTVTVNYLGDQMANTTGRQTSYEVESTDLAEGDKVLVTLFQDGAQFSIASMVKAKTVTGEITAVKSIYDQNTYKGKYAMMGETKYNYVGNTFAEDLADTALVDPTLNKENTLYLDTYGNMIAFEATERAVDYLYMKDAINDLNGIKALATFADGTSETISISKLTKLGGTVIKGTALDVTDLANTFGVYSYVKQGSTYELTELRDANSTANSWASAPAASGNYDDGATAGSNTYTIKKGLNAIQFNNGNTTQNIVSLNNSTIFVDVEGGVIYTGYANVPTMTDISFYVVYNKQLNADVVFITDGADNSTSDSYFMILDGTPVTSKKAADGTMYYEYKASVNGEEKTLIMKGINKDNAGNLFAKHALYKIETITPNNEITEASKVTRFSTTFNASGSYAEEKTSGTIRIKNDADIAQCGNNTVTGLNQDIYAYNNDTVFMNVELKADGSVSKVSRSSANAINTYNDDIPGYSNVYVVTVDDKDARTPVATLVYVVTPHESGVIGGGGYEEDGLIIADGVTNPLGTTANAAAQTVTSNILAGTSNIDVRARMKNAVQALGYTVTSITGNSIDSTYTLNTSEGITFSGTATEYYTITIDGVVVSFTVEGATSTSIPSTVVNDAGKGGNGFIVSFNDGSTYAYDTYTTNLNTLNSTNFTAHSNIVVKTGYVKVTGGTPAYAPVNTAYTVPAKGGSDNGTGMTYAIGGVTKYVVYGGTIPANEVTGDITLTKNMVKVTAVGFNNTVTGALKDGYMAYNSNITVGANTTTDLTNKGSGVKVTIGNTVSYVAYSSTINQPHAGDVTVEAGYVKFTGLNANQVTGKNISIDWTLNGSANNSASIPVKANSTVTVTATLTGVLSGYTAGNTTNTFTAEVDSNAHAAARFTVNAASSATYRDNNNGTLSATQTTSKLTSGETILVNYGSVTVANADMAFSIDYSES